MILMTLYNIEQIGEQDLAFGLKFNAKGIVDCYEKDLEDLPIGQRRDIEFKMVEGDFKLFEGKWSIEQMVDSSFPFSIPSSAIQLLLGTQLETCNARL